jgi:hypothetical protein
MRADKLGQIRATTGNRPMTPLFKELCGSQPRSRVDCHQQRLAQRGQIVLSHRHDGELQQQLACNVGGRALRLAISSRN